MDNYIVSALKYRPTTFESVVGQKALTTTLKNAIKNNKLAHAYLFCGPRGVGKTTCARIFAKTINCTNLTPEGEACNECESCRSFNEQRSLNIYELDAASNNGIEEMKALIEQVRIPPQTGRYKVYIIDEVHMLSTAAFNAFLKTLEEPPKYVIFILATTEKHKVLPTILSRCQVYDFGRISVKDIVDQLAFVAENEHIKADRDALNVIAMKADGGMRDSLSMFDQAASFTGGNITYQSIIENLNVLDYDYFFRFTDLLLENKVNESLLLFDEVLNKGFDGSRLINGMASHFRDLLVSHDESTVRLLEVSDNIRERYIEQAKRCPVKFLYRAIRLCNDCDQNYRSNRNKRLLVELTLIELAQITEPDSSGGGGTPPSTHIKPIKKIEAPAQTKGAPAAAAPTPAPSNVNVAPTEATTAEVATNTTPPPAPTTNVSATLHQPEKSTSTIKDLLSDKAETKENVPVISFDDLGVSLSGKKEQTPEEEKKKVAPKVAAANEAFDEQQLRSQISKYAGMLPKEKKALSLQLHNFALKMTDATTFEFTVDNQLAANELLSVKDSMEVFLRRALNNTNVTMSIRISENEERTKPVGGRETFQYMAKKNDALNDLQQTFDLVLS
jgi:DNA polymerase-3 subunit gamma/tau